LSLLVISEVEFVSAFVVIDEGDGFCTKKNFYFLA